MFFSPLRYFLNRRLVRQCIDGIFITKTVAAANAAKNAIKRGGEGKENRHDEEIIILLLSDCVWYGRVYCDGDVMIVSKHISYFPLKLLSILCFYKPSSSLDGVIKDNCIIFTHIYL